MGGNELDKRFRLVQSATACIPRHKSRVHHTRGAGQTPRGSRASSKRDIQKAQSKRRRMREPRHRLVRAASLPASWIGETCFQVSVAHPRLSLAAPSPIRPMLWVQSQCQSKPKSRKTRWQLTAKGVAANALLDRGWGKAAQLVAVDGEIRQLVEVKLNVVRSRDPVRPTGVY